MIKMENISKKYKDNFVLSNINLEFENGKSYAICGTNGSGKSVLLKLICGFSKPTTGVITVDGVRVGIDSDFIKDAGIFINTPEFINDLTGRQNLELIAQVRKKVTKQDIDFLLEKLLMTEYSDKKVKNYSLGMKQKLRIAQAIMENPSILILDEPMNALDKENVVLVRELLHEHVKKGNQLIFTSHNLEDVAQLADVIFEINKGTITIT
jgi:ABC-2 type transport system ATP-binding protein